MLSSKGFDLWADNYDSSVEISDESNDYPFAGYKDVLNTVYRIVRTKNPATVLDIGFGTGVLTNKLYQDGYSICGFDFSEKMLEIAKTKMPEATLINMILQMACLTCLKTNNLTLLFAHMPFITCPTNRNLRLLQNYQIVFLRTAAY